MTTLRVLLLPVLLCLLPGACTTIPRGGYPTQAQAQDDLRIWLMSDIQPRTPAERSDLPNAIADMHSAVSPVTLAVIAGDLLQSHSTREDFLWFNRTLADSGISHWYALAGNHDARNGELFRRYIGAPSYYGVRVGNVLLLLLSDESTGSATVISDAAFRWWREMVIANQDRIIITVTHGQLADSGLFTSGFPSRCIQHGERFSAVLRDYRVALWASGHSHLPNWLPGTVSRGTGTGATLFVNVSAIRADRFMPVESRLLVVARGSRTLWLRSRNHSRRRFDADLDVALPLDRAFNWDGSPPRIIVPDALRAATPDRLSVPVHAASANP